MPWINSDVDSFGKGLVGLLGAPLDEAHRKREAAKARNDQMRLQELLAGDGTAADAPPTLAGVLAAPDPTAAPGVAPGEAPPAGMPPTTMGQAGPPTPMGQALPPAGAPAQPQAAPRSPLSPMASTIRSVGNGIQNFFTGGDIDADTFRRAGNAGTATRAFEAKKATEARTEEERKAQRDHQFRIDEQKAKPIDPKPVRPNDTRPRENKTHKWLEEFNPATQKWDEVADSRYDKTPPKEITPEKADKLVTQINGRYEQNIRPQKEILSYYNSAESAYAAGNDPQNNDALIVSFARVNSPEAVQEAEFLRKIQAPGFMESMRQKFSMAKDGTMDEAVRKRLVDGVRRKAAYARDGIIGERKRVEAQMQKTFGGDWEDYRYGAIGGEPAEIATDKAPVVAGSPVKTAPGELR